MTENAMTELLANADALLADFGLSTDFAADFVFNSLSFENDGLKAGDVEKIIVQGKPASTRKDIVIRNHYAALLYTLSLIKRTVCLDENGIKDIHELLMKDLRVGGLYRNVDISIKGSNHTPPSHVKVYDRMKKYIHVLHTHKGDVYELAAFSHLQLAKIHPFLDGNGRLARLILLYYLVKNKFKPIIIPRQDKNKYFSLLEEFKVNKNMKPFIDSIKKLSQTPVSV